MGQFRKKPVVIEAVQYVGAVNGTPIFTGDGEGPRWLTDALESGALKQGPICLDVHTLEGVMAAAPDDWIIRGVKGEIYPCKPDIFAASYEDAKEEPWFSEDIITFRVEDRAGHCRIEGATQEKAEIVARGLAEDLIAAPLKLMRVIYQTRRRVEEVKTFGSEPVAPPCP
jgi:hypothetical protein